MIILKEITSKIADDELQIKYYKNEVSVSHTRACGITAIFPTFFNENIIQENREIAKDIMKYCANKMHYFQLTEANRLQNEMNEREITFHDHTDMIMIDNYKDGKSAMVRTFIGSNSRNNSESHSFMNLDPFIQFSSVSSNGFTVVPGSMSDFDIIRHVTGPIIGVTKDFIPPQFGIVTLFLEMYCQLFKDIIVDNKEKPEDFQEFTAYDFEYLNDKIRKNKKEILDYIINKISVNKRKRIDTLTVNGKDIKELLKEFGIRYRVMVNDTDIVNIGMILGKTPHQVHSYIDKVL